MNHTSRSVSVLFLLVLVHLIGVAYGQAPDNPMNPTDSQFSQNFDVDSVNLQDLSVGISVPVIRKPGAIPFSYTLAGNSSCISQNFSGIKYMQCGIGLNKFYGDSRSYILSGVTPTNQWTATPLYVSGPGTRCAGDGQPIITAQNVYITGPDLTTYYLPSTATTKYSSDGTGNCNSGWSGYALNGSGVYVVLTYARGGGAFVSSFTDVWNNQTHSQKIGEADTYQDTTGTNQSLQPVWGSTFTVTTAFSCPNITSSSFSGVYLPTGVQFPDGNNLGFQYESVSGGTTGRLYKLTLRTGGMVTYGYGALDCNAFMRSDFVTRSCPETSR